MLALKYKDIRNRFNFYKRELDKNIIKFFFINNINKKTSDNDLKKKLIYYYNLNLNAKFSKTRIQRRCILTNRARVSNRALGISRIRLRELLKYNIIPGYKKAVW